jgi:hypothetical protein
MVKIFEMDEFVNFAKFFSLASSYRKCDESVNPLHDLVVQSCSAIFGRAN